MSQTISVGVVGPSYWSYMAAAMAECLEHLIRTGRAEAGLFPGAVYQQAGEFFRLVLQAAGDDLPENPPASINAYVIATGLVRVVAAVPLEPAVQLKAYEELLTRLREPRDLTPDEKETAVSLQKFFLLLQKAGEVEAYERRVMWDAPAVGVLTRA